MFEFKDNKDQSPIIDFFLWFVFASIIGGSLYLYSSYSDVSAAIKVLFAIFSILLLISIAFFTKKGRIAYTFVLEASVELRKVVWPQVDEVRQVTLMVAALIGVISLILWGIDTGFSALVSYIAV
jgi:preprotein translocase subunit SecE